ncbi:Tim44/TimA family putative adaptor protein [Commensalibacter oyaizuii]|uniref:Tim44/TimA family putative adaptor protein n=1 Tax=Commensalibacter oyaizuii TaxID=3043873 RepID=A0ABT6PYT2_9PROT|nr:Tim44/TimA family putative adaptor protein [Commensalibacter sp. TBRC 16381]MDI2090013.1 Tim44/TimA family putative adaptor protein [Commensalibacter sp. TBRC 16381]
MDFSSGHFPIDIVILALVAGFLILRLRSVLGNKTEIDKKEHPVPAMVVAKFKPNSDQPTKPVEEVKPKVEINIPSPDTEIGQTLSRISQLDPTFIPQKFVEGAEIVFRKVLTAFANEDLPTLQSMLITEAYRAFEGAIHQRRNMEERQVIEIKSIHSITLTKAQVIEDASMNRAVIEVQFISNQINCTFDKHKNPVTGTESVTEFIDFWTFERMLGVNNQGISWRLKSARSG